MTFLPIVAAYGGQLTLDWTDNSTNEIGFRIERRLASGIDADFVEVATVARNVTTYTDNAVTNGTQYTYRLRAYNLAGNSAYTSNVTATPRLSQTITFGTLSAKTYGDPTFNLTATSDSALAVSYTSSNASVATVSGNVVTILGAGTTTITANQSGDSTYAPATGVPQTLTVNKATLTVTANNASRLYGASNPTFSTSITGFVNSESSTALTTQPTASTTATSSSNVGAYSIVPTGAAASNYAFTYVNGTLTITKATATVTLGNLSQTYSGTGKTASATTSPSGLTTTFTYNGSSTAPINAGSYTVVGTVSDTNYQGTGSGTLVIAQATPTVSWSTPAAITYGTALSSTQLNANAGLPGAYAYTPVSGTVLGAGANTLNVTFTPTDTTNYTTATGSVTQTVNKATLTATANNATRVYGASNPTFTVSYSGFVNGDTASAVTTAPAGATTATATSPVGTYAITASGGTAANYNFSYGSGTLTITKATATVSLSNLTQTADGNPKPVTVTTTPSGLTTTVTYAGSSTVPSAVGTYAVAATINDTNYQGTSIGTLTINSPLPPVVTSGTTASGTVGVPFSYTITASNLPTSFAATGLPGGLSVNATTGVISGTPTTAGAASASITASNVSGTSTPVTLTITIAAATAPTITSQPTNQSGPLGSSLVFSVTATGTPSPGYQWKKNSAPISGATNSTLTFNSVSSTDAATYTVDVSNVAGTVTSNPATLTIVSNVDSAPTFVIQPSSATVATGGSISLSAFATGSPTPTYQWRFNGVAIPGETRTDFVKTGLTLADSGNYDVVATNRAGITPSNKSVVTVNVAPVITSQPVSTSVNFNSDATFSVTASGTLPLTYQWRKDGVALTGQTNSTLTITRAKQSDAGAYDVVVSNAVSSVTSTSATLTVVRKSYAGTYSGQLAGGGTWSLYVKEDNSGTYLAYLPDRQSAIVTPVTIGTDGSVSVSTSELGGGPKTTTSIVDGRTVTLSAATSPVTLSLKISDTTVTGSLSGIGQSISGAADSGQNTSAGFYTAPAVGATSGTTYTLVGVSGKALVVTTTGTSVDGASGTLDSSGKLTSKTSTGGSVTVAVDASQQTISGSYTPSGATTAVNFSGTSTNVTSTTRLVNLSIRSFAGADSSSLIVGFAVSGGSKALLIRGVGPGLAAYGVTGFLDDPSLNVRSGNTSLSTNDDWGTGDTTAITSAGTSVGAFALTTGSRDAALLSNIDTGVYTAQVVTKQTATGIALAEIYDVAKSSAPHLVNLSARTNVGTGANVLIGGFIIEGNAPKQYLIRAIGPTLSTFGVTGVLADPQLEIRRQDSTTPLFQNNDWAGAADLKAAFTATGAFPLPDASKDAAALVMLAPGAYSAVVSGTNGTTGVALIEIYEMP